MGTINEDKTHFDGIVKQVAEHNGRMTINQEEAYIRKRRALISKFHSDDMKQLLVTDPMFRACFEMLMRGSDEYDIIEILIKDRIRLAKSFEDYVLKSTGRPIM